MGFLTDLIGWCVRVSVNLWKDRWFKRLDDKKKLVWLRLLISPEGSRCGIVEIDRAEICKDIRLKPKTLESILSEFSKDGRICLENDYCLLSNWLEYQRYRNSKAREQVLESLNKLLTEAPSLVSIWLEQNSNYDLTLDQGTIRPRVNDGVNADILSKEQGALIDNINISDSDESPNDASPVELEILGVLKDIPRWQVKFTYAKALADVRDLRVEFPRLDLLAVMKDMRAWLSDNPSKQAGKTRMRNFCKTAMKRLPAEPQSRTRPLEVMD